MVFGESNKNPTRRDLRLFGLSLVIGFALFGSFFWIRAGWTSGPWRWTGLGFQRIAVGCWTFGVVAGLICIVAESAGRVIFRVWTLVAGVIGRIMVLVGLTLIFVLLLPWFTFIRLSDPLRKKRGHLPSYWEPHRSHEPTLERTLRPF